MLHILAAAMHDMQVFQFAITQTDQASPHMSWREVHGMSSRCECLHSPRVAYLMPAPLAVLVVSCISMNGNLQCCSNVLLSCADFGR